MRLGVRMVAKRAGGAAARLAARVADGGALPTTSRLGAALLREREGAAEGRSPELESSRKVNDH